MAHIIETPNPFEPLVGMKNHTHPGGITIREWLGEVYPGFVEFDQPTICLVNGQPLLRKDWDRTINKSDIINFIAIVGEAATIIAIIYAVVIVALAVALVLMMPKPPGEGPGSDPVYSTKGQTNAIRLGEPIEVNYGRNRVFPSLASRPFFRYENNDQFQFSLFCIGQGEYEIEQLQIGDTKISDFQEVTYEVLPPGSSTTLFHSNTYTSPEAGGQELLGPNETPVSGAATVSYSGSAGVWTMKTATAHGFSNGDSVKIVYNGSYPESLTVGPITVVDATNFSFARTTDSTWTDKPFSPGYVILTADDVDGWVGPFPANPAATEVFKIEVDMIFPKGIFGVDKKGKIGTDTLVFEVQARLIDDAGDPLGDWTTLFNPTITAATTTPQRKTYSQEVDLGRYEVRSRRTSDKDLAPSSGNDIVWEGLRGFISGGEPDFGNVTLWAVKIRATNNLNSNSQQRFNVICTRKLPIRDPDTQEFGDPVATRSIIWAFIDIFRNSHYGGRIDEDRFFDWDALYLLDAFYEGRNEHFDWILRDPTTLWTASQMVARVGRALPLLAGSLITMRRDGPLEVPVALFTPDNIVKGSFEWNIKLWEPEEHDCVSVEYTEPATGYKQENVLAVLPGDTSDNPEDLRIPGIQDRGHAYREGMYYLASLRYLRENISFETGMEGLIPSYGDLVAISHDVPRWGQSGYILAVEDLGGGSYSLFVSEPLRFEESGVEYQILLRGKQGQIIGPVTAEPTSDSKVVTITLAEVVDFLVGGQTEPMIFLFGEAGQVTKYGRVAKIEPQGGERVRITLVNEAPTIHSFDDLEVPPLLTPSVPLTVPDLPVIKALYLSQVTGTVLTLQAAWVSAYGAQSYLVETSTDGEHWELRATTARTSVQLQTSPGLIYVRVAAMNNGQGPWIQDSIAMGLIFGLTIFIPWDDLEWGVKWLDDVNIDSYLVKVYDNTGPTPVLKRTVIQEEVEFIYTYDMAVADSNTVDRMLVTVDAMVSRLDSTELVAHGVPVGLELFHYPPLAPAESSLGYEFVSIDLVAGTVTYRVFWVDPIEGDLVRVQVWSSDTSGFDPMVLAPVFDFYSSRPGSTYVPVEAEITVTLSAGNVHPDWYWRVAVGDVWSSGSYLTDEETIIPPWILADATWADEGRWEDGEDWND